MVILPGCICCISCDYTSAFSSPSSMPLAITVVSNAASGSLYGTFSGLQSSYTLTQNSFNPGLYEFNYGSSPQFNNVQIFVFQYQGEFERGCDVQIRFPVGAIVRVEVSCYSGVLTARATLIAGGGGTENPGILVAYLQDKSFGLGASPFVSISAASPVLPIRVVGSFGYKPFGSSSYDLIPVDFTITGILPFEAMAS